VIDTVEMSTKYWFTIRNGFWIC